VPDYRRHLPHWQPDGVEFFVTWRLHGSLPVCKTVNDGRSFVEMDRRLDLATDGPRWMDQPAIADCIVETLLKAERPWDLCRLTAWAVMPNHVHVLLFPFEALSQVLLVLKSASARAANRALGRGGQRFWQEESFDRWVRNSHERDRIIHYIESNPVKAGLARTPEEWRWSSAGWDRPMAGRAVEPGAR
jgi:putative transposase